MKPDAIKNKSDTAEINEHLKYVRKVCDEALIAQRNYIIALKNELTKVKASVCDYELRKGQSVKAIMSALTKANKLDKCVRRKIANELSVLPKIHKRWAERFAKLLRKYPLDSDLAGVNNADKSIIDVLEKAGLSREADLKVSEAAAASKPKDHAAAKAKEDNEQFDYEAALHPDENLEQILEYLGVMPDDKK